MMMRNAKQNQMMLAACCQCNVLVCVAFNRDFPANQ